MESGHLWNADRNLLDVSCGCRNIFILLWVAVDEHQRYEPSSWLAGFQLPLFSIGFSSSLTAQYLTKIAISNRSPASEWGTKVNHVAIYMPLGYDHWSVDVAELGKVAVQSKLDSTAMLHALPFQQLRRQWYSEAPKTIYMPFIAASWQDQLTRWNLATLETWTWSLPCYYYLFENRGNLLKLT